MAEESDDISRNSLPSINPSDSDDDDNNSVIPDLGIENIRGVDKRTQCNESYSTFSSGTSETTPKREENPISFKHFLSRDTGQSYQNQGARPKIYTTHSLTQQQQQQHNVMENPQPRHTPEYPSSALPDFVQDHLVIEQCYLGLPETSLPKPLTIDLDNLPDFTSNTNRNLPARPRVGFPLDLPLTDSSAQQVNCTRNCSQTQNEVGVSKSLPDFLSDGAVYSQPEDSTIQSDLSVDQQQIEHLRRELKICKRQMMEQKRRADQLQRQLDASHDKQHEYTHNLAKAMEQTEEDLNISKRRALTAENAVVKLKQEVKQLTMEIAQVQKENRMLRGEEGATGGGAGANFVNISDNTQTQRFAQELRQAAVTAEHSLRQLLSGVDNLRLMASTLENMNRIEERTDSFLSDLDEETGPAL